MATLHHYRDNFRTAARRILDDTPLGSRLADLGAVSDDGTLLAVTANDSWWYDGSLSSGELYLFDWLASLATREQVNLRDLAHSVDADCQVAVLHSLAAAFGIGIAVEDLAGAS